MQNGYFPTLGTPKRDPTGVEYHSSQAVHSTIPLFGRRNEPIDWRRIAAIDLNRVSRDMDVQVLQDNLQQITFCNIDTEVDSRSMDPNFSKLFKLAQFIIEYLLTCQDQIGTQLMEYEQLKKEFYHEKDFNRHEIEKLKTELTETKKESKKRRKMLETQQRMLLAQNSNYHTCPVCTHAFLSHSYLEAHISRRHPDYRPKFVPPERDVDSEREVQRLRDELRKRESELHALRVQKTADEDRIRDRDSTIRQLKKQTSSSDYVKLSNNEQYEQYKRENVTIRQENEKLSIRLKEEQKSAKRYLEEIQKLEEQNENFRKSSSHSIKAPAKHETYERSNKKEVAKFEREESEDEVAPTRIPSTLKRETTGRTAIERESRPSNSPIVERVSPATKAKNLLLSKYCTTLVEAIKQNPNILANHRAEAEETFESELSDPDGFGILPNQKRLTELDYRTKFDKVQEYRRSIQQSLGNFEQIRRKVEEEVNYLIENRFSLRRSNNSIRSVGNRSVTFDDRRKIGDNESIEARRTPKSPEKFSSDGKKSIGALVTTHFGETRKKSESESSSESEPSNSEKQIRPAVRRKIPESGKSGGALEALLSNSVRPPPSSVGKPMEIKPARRVEPDQFESDEESENSISPRNFEEKKRKIEEKLRQSGASQLRPSVNALAQGFLPNRRPIVDQKSGEDEENETLTTLHTHHNGPKSTDDNPRNGTIRHLAARTPLSSADLSMNTYDSALKSNENFIGRGTDSRRPPTADSAKTSNYDSEDDLE